MDTCVKLFRKFTGCSIVEALEAATVHPAKAINVFGRKGTLAYGADADLVLLNDNLDVLEVYVNGELGYRRNPEDDPNRPVLRDEDDDEGWRRRMKSPLLHHGYEGWQL